MFLNYNIDTYLNEISKIPLINHHEEIELARRIKNNDKEALQKLVSANLRFVVSVSKSFLNKGLSLEDLINEGNIGLIKAAHRFDETRGFKFISYAVWWIRQSIMQALAEKTNQIRLPVNRVGIITKINRAKSAFIQENEREPTNAELASITELTTDEVQNSLKDIKRPMSIDDKVNAGMDIRVIDVISNDEFPATDAKLMENSLKKDVSETLKILTTREQIIIKMYFGLDGNKPHTLEEVGVVLKLTRERIRQIKERALQKLRSSESNKLRIYLG